MKKMYKFLFAFLMLQHFIIDDDGAGTNIDDIDIDDNDDNDNDDNAGGDNDADNFAKDKDDNAGGDKNSIIKSLQDKLKAVEKSVSARDNADKLNSSVNALKAKHSDFDETKVKDYLVELNKTNPERANELNNPIGWENIHLNEFKSKEVDNDNPNFGRNITPADRSEEVLEKVNQGEVLSIEDEMSYYGSNL